MAWNDLPHVPEGEIELTQEERLQEGEQFLSAHQYSDAKNVFQALVEEFPYHAKYWVYLGKSDYGIKAPLLAEKNWRRAVELNPLEKEAYMMLGNLAFERKAFDLAIFYWEQLTKIDPANDMVWFSLGNAYEQKKMMGPAFSAYQQFIDLADSKNAHAASTKRKMDRGMAAYQGNVDQVEKYMKLKQLDAVAKLYGKALEYYPGTAQVFRAYATVLYRGGKFDEAIKAYLQGLEKDSSSLNSYVNLGVIYEKKQQPVDAMWAYNEAIQLDSEGNPKIKIRFEQLVKTKPQHFQIALNQANTLIGQQEFAAADVILKRLDKLSVHYDALLSTAVQDQLMQMRYREDPYARAEKAFYENGMLALKEDRTDAATIFLQHYLEHFPNGKHSQEIQNLFE